MSQDLTKALSDVGLTREIDIPKTQKLLKEWGDAKTIREDLKFFLERAQEYQIKVTSYDIFVIGSDFRPIRRHHLASMLRGDYLRAGRHLRGKTLERAVKYFLDTQAPFFTMKARRNEIECQVIENLGEVFSNEKAL